MSNLVPTETSSHWYFPDGRPLYEVPYANGKPGARKATLADARKVKAYPSVTGILACLAKPGLESWKIEQAILSSITMPWLVGENADAFAKRVAADADTVSGAARDFGVALHDACAEYAQAGIGTTDPLILPFFEPWAQWYENVVGEVIACETVQVSPRGYAGRVDIVCRLRDGRIAVIDWKTQKVKNGKPVFYDEWPLQLAAYRAARPHNDGEVPSVLMSVVINATEPGPVAVMEWPEPPDYLEVFLHLFEVWKYVKRYDPAAVEPLF